MTSLQISSSWSHFSRSISSARHHSKQPSLAKKSSPTLDNPQNTMTSGRTRLSVSVSASSKDDRTLADIPTHPATRRISTASNLAVMKSGGSRCAK